MNNKKTTKRALISSMLSLFVCVTMLIGTTFAWFTDKATSGVNTIQSGKLDVVLEYSTDGGTTWADAEGQTLNFKTADDRTTDILWEPGCTYELPLLRVRNNGNLAFKYHMVVNGVDGDAKLLEAIEWTANDAALTTFSGALDKNGDTSETILIKGHMKESAGNEYQDLTINGIGITVYATQNTVENDSLGNTYDAMATVDNVDELKAALEKDSILITFGSDIELTEKIVIPAGKEIAFELNGHTLSSVSTATGSNYVMINVLGDLTVRNGNVVTEHTGENMAWNNSTSAIEAVSGGKLTLVNTTVKNLGGSDMAYGVNIGNNGGATLKSINSTIESVNYVALRVFNNANGAIDIDMTDNSVLKGKSNPFWVHFWTEADLGDKKEARQAYLSVDFNDTKVSRYSGSKSLFRFGFTDAIYYSDAALTEVVAGTEAALNFALANGKDVVLNNDFNDYSVENNAPYGNYYGIALNGGILDGNGKVLDFEVGPLKNGKADNYGIMTSGGTIKNITIGGVFRGIMIMNPTEDLIIDNAVIGDEDVCYGINTGEGDGTKTVTISNSTLMGWNSFGTAVKSVNFTNCEFVQGTYYTNVYGRLVKPYVDTVFENCDFVSKYYIDLSALSTDGDGNVVNPNAKVILKNCTVDGVKLTAENWKELVAPEATCGAGQISVELKDGTYLTADNIVDYIIFE